MRTKSYGNPWSQRRCIVHPSPPHIYMYIHLFSIQTAIFFHLHEFKFNYMLRRLGKGNPSRCVVYIGDAVHYTWIPYSLQSQPTSIVNVNYVFCGVSPSLKGLWQSELCLTLNRDSFGEYKQWYLFVCGHYIQIPKPSICGNPRLSYTVTSEFSIFFGGGRVGYKKMASCQKQKLSNSPNQALFCVKKMLSHSL